VEAGYTARKFLTKQGVTNILPITATLGRLNEAYTVESAVLSAIQLLSINNKQMWFGRLQDG